jgi:hypothetical protein
MSVFCPLKSSPTSLPECSSALADAICGGAWLPMLPGMSTGAKTAPPLGSPSSILCRHWLWCLGLGGIGVDRRRQNHSTSRVSFFHSLLTLALASRAGWDWGRLPAPERTSSRSRVSAFPVRVVGEPKTLGIIALLPIEALKGWIHLVALSFIAGMFPSHVRCGMTKLLVLLPQANPNGPGKAQQLDDFCSSCSWLFAVNSTSRRKRA